MRMLVVSNFYPPHYVGGYELGCRDVVEGLKARGHDVRVLTSIYGVDRPHHSDGVYRWLETDFASNTPRFSPHLFDLFRKEVTNKRALKRLSRGFRPDVVYAWNITYISTSVVFAAQQMGLPVCYFVSDQWLSRWETDSWYSQQYRKPRRLHRRLMWKPLRFFLSASGLLAPYRLDLSHVQFASHFLKQAALQANMPVANAEVFHWGIDVNRFAYKKVARDPRRLLYVGQITSHKGVHTAVEALKLILEQPCYKSVTLTIVGGPDYDGRVQRQVSSLGLESNIRFTGRIDREHLPQIYQEHDILVFPSIWDEPFSITLLEGMASGLAVVGTATGGSAEILEDEMNALIFPKQDAHTCASQILRLVNDPKLFERIRHSGRRTIEEHFRLERMMDKIERSMKETAG